MTYEGAITQLKELMGTSLMPELLKPSLEAVIETLEMERSTGEWIKDRNPDKDGAYLCITGINDMIYFRHILYFTNDLYKKDHNAFYEYRYKRKDKRSGWYDVYDYGYYEITDVLAWCELSEIPEEFRCKNAKKNEDT